MKPIIRVENLSKQYQLGGTRKPYETFRESIVNTVKAPFMARNSEKKESFWALSDINFDVYPGEVVGIIGKNGAGKSTLLKILSRITEPTSGKIELYGRVGSLLEVGTGFHPELTGRENIFLNGAILGMRREEIVKKLDEIVDFSEIEKFIDTPVKHYSSGMYVRLAFAVAAHLQPEILIIDEVLAVGDTDFQKKCLGKMDEVSKTGRTVLFVSHQMGTIVQLCNRTIVLNKGEVKFEGNTSKAIDYYINTDSNKVDILKKEISEIGVNDFQFLSVYNCSEPQKYKSTFRHDESISLMSEIYVPYKPTTQEFAVSLYDRNKRRVLTIHEPLSKYYDGGKIIKLLITIPPDFITPGFYSWLMCINFPGIKLSDLQDDICAFTITDTGSDFASHEGADYGCVFAKYSIDLIK